MVQRTEGCGNPQPGGETVYSSQQVPVVEDIEYNRNMIESRNIWNLLEINYLSLIGMVSPLNFSCLLSLTVLRLSRAFYEGF